MNDRTNAGFTLMEILVVVLIIGLLTTLLASQLIPRFSESQITIAGAKIQKISQSLELYRLDNGIYPTNDQGLEALVSEPASEPQPRRYPPGGYLKAGDIVDPWGMGIEYQQPGDQNAHSYDLISHGPDAQSGTEDDVTNWDDTLR